MMRKQIVLALASAACVLATGAAHAGNVYWSIGINAPPVGTVISNAPVYAPAPVVVPAPVYVPPAPVYVPPPVVYEPPPVVYEPAPVVYAPSPFVVAPRIVYRTGFAPYVVRGPHHHRDEYGERYDERRWAPVPVDPRRQHHDVRDR